MTDLEQAALAVYFANCQGIKSDPLPMLRKILALGEGDRRDAEKWRDVGFLCNAEGVAELKRHADAAERDARRYRWIRDKQLLTDAPRFPIACPDSISSCDMRHTRTAQGEDLDAAIDAAMTTTRPESV